MAALEWSDALALAPWTEAELKQAEAAAKRVAQQIGENRFWPPAHPPPAYSEEFASICLDGVFGAGPPPDRNEA